MSIKHYEVQTHTVVDGWVNTWSDDGKPWTFATKADATRAIDEFFIDLPAHMLASYDVADYRVQPVFEETENYDNGLADIDDYEQRVRVLEAEGMTRSDAQAVADAEVIE